MLVTFSLGFVLLSYDTKKYFSVSSSVSAFSLYRVVQYWFACFVFRGKWTESWVRVWKSIWFCAQFEVSLQLPEVCSHLVSEKIVILAKEGISAWKFRPFLGARFPLSFICWSNERVHLSPQTLPHLLPQIILATAAAESCTWSQDRTDGCNDLFYALVRNANFQLGALNFAQLKPVYDLLLIFYIVFTSELSHCREK